jgi:hypothetical protein
MVKKIDADIVLSGATTIIPKHFGCTTSISVSILVKTSAPEVMHERIEDTV